MKYNYFNMIWMQKVAANMATNIEAGAIGDFHRTGIEIYVGSFPDVSGPDLVIDPNDQKGVELFKEFCTKLADHFKQLNQQ